MKKFSLSALHAVIVGLMICTASCIDRKPDDSKEVAEEKNERKFEKGSNEKDAQFLVDAAAMSREEIALGQLAQQKANIRHVKELGKMIADGHNQSLIDLTVLAKIKNISLPNKLTESGQEVYEKLDKVTGNEFGKTYSDMMVKRHKETIARFEKASEECADPDIRAWSTSTLPVLRIHLIQSLVCQKDCKKL